MGPEGGLWRVIGACGVSGRKRREIWDSMGLLGVYVVLWGRGWIYGEL